MKNTLQKSIIALSAMLALGAGAGITALASAQSIDTDTPAAASSEHRGMSPRGMGGHGVRGTVAGVDGSTLTITNTDGTSYTVDASEAKVSKVVDLTMDDIRVGDEVGVMGEVSGTSIVAKHIMDGIPQRPQGPPTDK